jgi:hypothetical protein
MINKKMIYKKNRKQIKINMSEFRPIMKFAEQKNNGYQLTRKILMKGMNPNYKNGFGSTLFHKISKYGRLSNLTWLLRMPEVNRETLNQQNCRGETALHIACSNGLFEFTNKFLRSVTCLDLEIQDNAGYTPLLRAFEKGHLQLVQLLIYFGADWSRPHNEGWTLASEMVQTIMEAEEGQILDLQRFIGVKEYVTDYSRFFISRKVLTQTTLQGQVINERVKQQIFVENPISGHWELSSEIIPEVFRTHDSVPSHMIHHYKKLLLDSKELCPICMETYEDETMIMVLNEVPDCYHTLCRKCYDRVTECPMCRKPISK